MKKALSIILSLCIAAAILLVAVSCGKTDTEVKGEPKTVYEYYENGNVEKSSDYDSKGYLVKDSYYDTEGKFTGYIVYENDENGNKIKESYYNSEDKLSSYSVYEYDESGKKTKCLWYYYSDGKLVFYNVYEYDKNGNYVKESLYDDNGKLIDTDTYRKK